MVWLKGGRCQRSQSPNIPDETDLRTMSAYIQRSFAEARSTEVAETPQNDPKDLPSRLLLQYGCDDECGGGGWKLQYFRTI